MESISEPLVKYTRVQLWIRAHSPYYEKAVAFNGNELFSYLHKDDPDLDPVDQALWAFNVRLLTEDNQFDGNPLTRDDIQYVTREVWVESTKGASGILHWGEKTIPGRAGVVQLTNKCKLP
jgi:hypothetical protein